MCQLIRLLVLSLSLTGQLLYTGALPARVVPIEHLSIDVTEQATLQRGAMLYMNYCSGCHSLKYLRYNRMAKDLGLTTFSGQVDEPLLKNNLIFTEATVYDPIHIAMPAVDAKQWFGMVPPDLSLSARARGTVWLYNYLHGFYRDDTRPFGSNNLLIADVAMPNVLAPLAGEQTLVQFGDHPELSLQKTGVMTQAEFDATVLDLVTFLAYAGEPAQLLRHKLGVSVLIFFSILLILTYFLKQSYWQQLKYKHPHKNK